MNPITPNSNQFISLNNQLASPQAQRNLNEQTATLTPIRNLISEINTARQLDNLPLILPLSGRTQQELEGQTTTLFPINEVRNKTNAVHFPVNPLPISPIQNNLTNASNNVISNLSELIDNLKLIDDSSYISENCKNAIKENFSLSKFYECRRRDDPFEDMLKTIAEHQKKLIEKEKKVKCPETGLTLAQINTLAQIKNEDCIESHLQCVLRIFNLLLDNSTSSLRERKGDNKIKTRTLRRIAHCSLIYKLCEIRGMTRQQMEKEVADFREDKYPPGNGPFIFISGTGICDAREKKRKLSESESKLTPQEWEVYNFIQADVKRLVSNLVSYATVSATIGEKNDTSENKFIDSEDTFKLEKLSALLTPEAQKEIENNAKHKNIVTNLV